LAAPLAAAAAPALAAACGVLAGSGSGGEPVCAGDGLDEFGFAPLAGVFVVDGACDSEAALPPPPLPVELVSALPLAVWLELPLCASPLFVAAGGGEGRGLLRGRLGRRGRRAGVEPVQERRRIVLLRRRRYRRLLGRNEGGKRTEL